MRWVVGEVAGEIGVIRIALAMRGFQALKSRLVGGVIFDIFLDFIGFPRS